MKRLSAAVPVVFAASAAAFAFATNGAAQPGERTFTLYEDATHETIQVIDEAPKSPSPDLESKRFRFSPGDRLVGITPVFDKKGGKRVGTLYGSGTVIKGTNFGNITIAIEAVFDLNDGQIMIAGTLRDQDGNRAAVVGGTGAYEGARGTQTEKDLGVGGIETFRLLP